MVRISSRTRLALGGFGGGLGGFGGSLGGYGGGYGGGIGSGGYVGPIPRRL